MGSNLDLLTAYRDNCGFGLLASLESVASHKNLEDAITSLERMMHRGAIAADGKSGDGCGLLLSMPEKFMRNIAKNDFGCDLPEMFAVGMVFATQKSDLDIFISVCQENDLKVLFIREVPIATAALGELALQTLPFICQVFVAPNTPVSKKRFDALLYLSRKLIEHAMRDKKEFYIPTFSSKVIAYKGLLMPTHIKEFYVDLNQNDFEISFALFHQRFSTNTLPKWRLAQPFRAIAHNGEINSVEANRFNIAIKSENLQSSVFSEKELQKILPILQEDVSDSASLDNVFEFLIVNNVDFFKAARSLVPAPWQNSPHMDSKLRAFYEYTSTAMEPWDGPAAVSLTDGRHIGCLIDRNGLRPSKYIITKDKRIIITSEYGTLDIDEDDILERSKLKSGEMIGIDLAQGIVLRDEDINTYLKTSQPYTKWLNSNLAYVQEFVDETFIDFSDYRFDDLENRQKLFNITYETFDQMIEPMANEAKEPVGSMGDDAPLAAFSSVQRDFTDYFRQKFAQVTNPPIDPYREKVVMSLNTGFGSIHNILSEDPSYAKRLKATSPILMKEKFDILTVFGDANNERYEPMHKSSFFSTCFESNLQQALQKLADDVILAVKQNDVRIVILDDRGVSKQYNFIPMAMACGYINQKLLESHVRHLVSIVCVSGETIDAHSCAVLIAYGAAAIYPYMLYASTVNLFERKQFSQYQIQEKLKNIQTALNGGLLKIMSKMGIATIASYRNSALFDIFGLDDTIVHDCFRGSHSDLAGLGYLEIEQRLSSYHVGAYHENNNVFPINLGGIYKYIDGGEYHDYGPAMTKAMHNKLAKNSDEISDFTELRNLIANRDKKMIRDFFTFKSDRQSIDIAEVESKEAIFKRFVTAAMSLGSISPEAHEALAEAMNTLGGQSNSGEGGEDSARFGTIKNSKIKQVASGRFGVTPGYLVSAEELQIKVAQGAKPGEGGQLPGHKVTPLIARLRHTIEGVTLISPPPHHDIYSIEDLAQLIFDLKQVNPEAKIAVKLVSSMGVGTIAAGVAKAYADKIIISGGDGGTGAAPLTSIKHAGNPWEIGLSEAHNALKANHLREFVHLQTDGGLKTGLDVVKAAMLGAESYGFGTGALTILGCKILRICHTNKCSVGVATQDENLRHFFVGTVERLVAYFHFIAEDIREILAQLGYTSLQEIIGRSDLLEVIDDKFAKQFDFSNILRRLEGPNTCKRSSNEPFDKNEFEKDILLKVQKTITNPDDKSIVDAQISNLNRSFGAFLSGKIAQKYGDMGLPSGSITINLCGVAGQSFGAFLSKGISLHLSGAANDYVGKGMHGGQIVITPNANLSGENFGGAGNTCLYGATGGKLFICASVGERFAVRNSGAIAVVEGVGDNACEYMTGGIIVILGETGINFGAGMTGGLGFVYDYTKSFADKINRELIELVRIDTDDAEKERIYLKNLLKDFYAQTNSQKARFILDNFRAEIRYFWMVKPKSMRVLPLNPAQGD